ncbi:D-alanyl-D-alanine-carboxypeptidase/endopeptidase AmpH [Klebsiella pneumoniae]|nr:D-alanyl-D-alanine-carboxypeptidase/endopeptidase AmpH [Klebsiella pneumoniae]
MLIFAALCAASWTSVQAAQPTVDPVFASDVVDRYANHIYYGSGATGMALVVIDGNQRVFRSFGETRPGNNQHPQLDSVIRIASLSKLMTSEMLVKLLDRGVVKLNDPLSKYAPPGARVPDWQGKPITLVNLATHTSALPREQHWWRRSSSGVCLADPPAALELALYRDPESRAGLAGGLLQLAFDLLADALATAAGKPYPQLFEEQITRPLGMKDTTFTPSPDQCQRLMIPEKAPAHATTPWRRSAAAESTRRRGDMMRWMQQFLSSDFYTRSQQADRMQTLIYQRNQLTRVIGMDVPGRADALGLGWVYEAEERPSGDYSENRRRRRVYHLWR